MDKMVETKGLYHMEFVKEFKEGEEYFGWTPAQLINHYMRNNFVNDIDDIQTSQGFSSFFYWPTDSALRLNIQNESSGVPCKIFGSKRDKLICLIESNTPIKFIELVD